MAVQYPDLLELLAEHDHRPDGCAFEAGYVAALTRAAAYVQDYAGDLPKATVVRLQAPLLRAIAVAQCRECDPHGHVVRDGRHVDHHPLGGPT